MRRSLVLLAAALSMGCAVAATAVPAKPDLGTWGVDLTAMDRSVKPGDDFFSYVNGSWVKKTTIPAERSSIGAFQLLRILSEKRMKAILAELDGEPYASLNDNEKKLRDFYDAFMDQKQIDSRGLAPVSKELAEFAHLKTREDVARAMGTMFQKQDRAKYIDLPLSNYSTWPNDKVLKDGEMVGVSTFSGYSSNESSMLSLAMVDVEQSEPGTEVTLVWGEEGGGSAKPVVERHVQTEIRATVSPAPYAEVVRASYRPR